jgi:hypothetical protein
MSGMLDKFFEKFQGKLPSRAEIKKFKEKNKSDKGYDDLAAVEDWMDDQEKKYRRKNEKRIP